MALAIGSRGCSLDIRERLLGSWMFPLSFPCFCISASGEKKERGRERHGDEGNEEGRFKWIIK